MLKFFSLTRPSVYILFLNFSAILSYLIIPAYFFFPFTGLSVFFLFISTGVYFLLQHKALYPKYLYGVCLLLSLFLIFRANPFLTLLNIMGILYAGSLLTLYGKMKYGIANIFFSPLLLLIGIFKTKSFFDLPKTTFTLPEKYRKVDEHLPAIGLTIVLLMIIIPLLSYANPFFNDLVRNISNSLAHFLSLEWLFRQNLLPYIVRTITFFLLLFFIPRLFTIATFSKKEFDEEMVKSQINYVIPKVAVGIVLIVFFITQMQLYMASSTELLKIGYTNSQQTREIFAQLCIVTGIILGLLYADKNRTKYAEGLTYLLLFEAAFLNLIALKSDYDYSHTWGFTEKRLYGFSGIVWLFAVLGFYLKYYTDKLLPSWLLKSIVGITAMVLLLINVTNFDYLIYHYAKSTTHSGTDYMYLSNLSSDADSYDEILPKLIQKLDDTQNTQDLNKYMYPGYNTLYTIDYLKFKYTHFHLGSFNLSEYLMYQKTKNMPWTKYKKRIDYYQQKYYNAPVPPTNPTSIPQNTLQPST